MALNSRLCRLPRCRTRGSALIKRRALYGSHQGDTIKTITTHYIDEAYVESHGRKVIDVVKLTNGQVIARVTLGDEEDTRRAIAAAKRAFASFSRTANKERSRYLRQLHKAVSSRWNQQSAPPGSSPGEMFPRH